MCPDLAWEDGYRREGFVRIAGLDEVGMGCLAGPVVAAAVILPSNNLPDGIEDSKRLSAKKREALSIDIQQCAIAWAIGMASVEEIDAINIYQASRLAMVRAVAALTPSADCLLIDGRGRVESALPQRALVKGDSLSLSIAAASILAKVHRDALMRDMDGSYPGYDFSSHKGYGSKSHRLSLQRLGPSPIHRKSFSWTAVSELIEV